jgi:hypothetical protein
MEEFSNAELGQLKFRFEQMDMIPLNKLKEDIFRYQMLINDAKIDRAEGRNDRALISLTIAHMMFPKEQLADSLSRIYSNETPGLKRTDDSDDALLHKSILEQADSLYASKAYQNAIEILIHNYEIYPLGMIEMRRRILDFSRLSGDRHPND